MIVRLLRGKITGMGTCTVNPEYAVEIAAVLAREFPELATQIARKCRACICPLAEKIDRAVGEAIVVMPPETPPGVPPTHYHQ